LLLDCKSAAGPELEATTRGHAMWQRAALAADVTADVQAWSSTKTQTTSELKT
jgi:hypothetical protein